MQHAHVPAHDLTAHVHRFRSFLDDREPGLTRSWLTDAIAVKEWVDVHGVPRTPIRPLRNDLPVADVTDDEGDTTPVLHFGSAGQRVSLLPQAPGYGHYRRARMAHPNLSVAVLLMLGLVPMDEAGWHGAPRPDDIHIEAKAAQHHPWLRSPAQARWDALLAGMPDWLAQHGYTMTDTSTAPGPRGEITRLATSAGDAFELTRAPTPLLRVSGKFVPGGKGVSVTSPAAEGVRVTPENVFGDDWFFNLPRRVMGLQTIRL